jgi:hypothetical protein
MVGTRYSARAEKLLQKMAAKAAWKQLVTARGYGTRFGPRNTGISAQGPSPRCETKGGINRWRNQRSLLRFLLTSRRGGGHVAIVSRVEPGIVYVWNATGGQSD